MTGWIPCSSLGPNILWMLLNHAEDTPTSPDLSIPGIHNKPSIIPLVPARQQLVEVGLYLSIAPEFPFGHPTNLPVPELL